MHGMIRKLLQMRPVKKDLNKMAYLMFALRYFDVSGFLEVVSSHLSEFLFYRGSKPPESKCHVKSYSTSGPPMVTTVT